MDIFALISAGLGLVSVFFGTHLIKVKNLITDGAKAVKELEDILNQTDKALEDRKLSTDELRQIVKELKEAKDAALVVIEDVAKLFKK